MKGTKEVRLIYGRGTERTVNVVSSAIKTRYGMVSGYSKSKRGSALFYNNGLVICNSRKQRIVALSATEAEWIALVEDFKLHKSIHTIFPETRHFEGPWKINFHNNSTRLIVAMYRPLAKYKWSDYLQLEGHRLQWYS